MTSPERTASAEIPDSVCRRTPRSGAVRPVRARQTISSPARKAIAAPVAPVRCWARSVMALIAGSRSSSAAWISVSASLTDTARKPDAGCTALATRSWLRMERRHARMIVDELVVDAVNSRVGHGAQQVADETVELGVGDEVRGLLVP